MIETTAWVIIEDNKIWSNTASDTRRGSIVKYLLDGFQVDIGHDVLTLARCPDEDIEAIFSRVKKTATICTVVRMVTQQEDPPAPTTGRQRLKR